jgi:hypothetical protein
MRVFPASSTCSAARSPDWRNHLRFLDAVSQGIGICWIIAVLKAATVYVGRVTEVAFLTACRTARVRH